MKELLQRQAAEKQQQQINVARQLPQTQATPVPTTSTPAPSPSPSVGLPQTTQGNMISRIKSPIRAMCTVYPSQSPSSHLTVAASSSGQCFKRPYNYPSDEQCFCGDCSRTGPAHHSSPATAEHCPEQPGLPAAIHQPTAEEHSRAGCQAATGAAEVRLRPSLAKATTPETASSAE